MKIKREEEEAQVNMTPMIDCVFQLLIFFMLIADMSNMATDREISLPYADKTVKIDINDPVIVNVRRDGTMWVGSEQVLENRLIQILKHEGDRKRGADGISEQEIFIRGDEFCKWENVQKVMWHAQDQAIYKIKLGSSGDPNKIRK
ncbi:MAG: biopolymer transporter ExbD [Planctomycetota bacterium]